MMIQLNGEQHVLPDDLTVSDLIDQLGFAGQRVAVEVNGELISRSQWPQVRLKPNDKAEIVRAIGGG